MNTRVTQEKKNTKINTYENKSNMCRRRVVQQEKKINE